jgi:hypothetical protein
LIQARATVGQILDPHEAKLHEEVGGGPLGYLAYLVDEAKRLDPKLGQLPRATARTAGLAALGGSGDRGAHTQQREMQHHG